MTYFLLFNKKDINLQVLISKMSDMKNTLFLTLLFCCLVGYAQTPMSRESYESNGASPYYKQYNSTSPYLYNRPDAEQRGAGRSMSESGSLSDCQRISDSRDAFRSGSRMSSNIYKPFSQKSPSSVRRKAGSNGNDDDDDDDWGYGGGGTGDNPGDPEQNPFAPIGEGWCLALFAVAFMLLRMSRKKKHSCV